MTNDTDKTTAALQRRLEEVLAAYGADRSRWPESDRELLKDVGVEQASAQTDEARELDAILSMSERPSVPEGAATAVAARILSEAPQEERTNVVTLDKPARSAPRSMHDHSTSVWPAAALLAASLMIGVFLGQSDLFSGTLERGFLSADASVDDLSDAVFGLPIDALNFSEETL